MIYINHREVLEGRVTIVDVSGPLDSETAGDFEDYIRKLLEKSMIYILLDAGEIPHVSSEGIGAMLFIQKRFAEKYGFFVIYSLNREIAALFSLLGFDKVLRIVSSRIEAMEIMDRQMELRDGGTADDEEPVPGLEGRDLELNDLPPEPDSLMDTEEEKRPEQEPLIIECRKCSSLIRTRAPGEYLCPECRARFIVDGDMGVHFL
jgi:anti-sigma B factor antagonist